MRRIAIALSALLVLGLGAQVAVADKTPTKSKKIAPIVRTKVAPQPIISKPIISKLSETLTVTSQRVELLETHTIVALDTRTVVALETRTVVALDTRTVVAQEGHEESRPAPAPTTAAIPRASPAPVPVVRSESQAAPRPPTPVTSTTPTPVTPPANREGEGKRSAEQGQSLEKKRSRG